MNLVDAINVVKPHLTKERFEHTLRVAETARDLANRFHESEDKAQISAIFHDYAKYRPLDEMKRIIKETYLPKDLLYYHHELWHGPVASILIEREYGITDMAIQQAIYCHTTGKAHMSNLDMILFTADYIEPGRSFPGLDEVRDMANRDLLKATWLVSRNTINYLIMKNQRIYPDTFHAYNDILKRINGGMMNEK